jgi:ferredoxin-NADP reductase
MADLTWYNGVFYKIEQETHNTRRYYIEFPEMEKIDFTPGQFVTMDLPIHEVKNKRWRSYSIASAPDGTNKIELVIVLAENGAGTTYLFDNIKEGMSVPMRGPLGKFTLHHPIEKDICFICTGTGIAPFRSMIKDFFNTGKQHKNLYLIFGTRVETDILYRVELEQLAKDMPNFNYIPVLSRAHDAWTGEKGYVHPVYERLFAGRNDVQFMLCGWTAMINEAKDRLYAMGFEKKDVHYELYG